MRARAIVVAAAALLGAVGGTGALGTILVTGASIDSGSGDQSKGEVTIDPAFPLVLTPPVVEPEPLGDIGSITGPLPSFPGAGDGSDGVFTSGSSATLPAGAYDFTSFTVEPDATVTCSGAVTIRVTGNVLIEGALVSAGTGHSIVLYCGGDFTVGGGPNFGMDWGILTTGGSSLIEVFSDGAVRLGDPVDDDSRAFLRADSGSVTLTGTDPAAPFEIANGIVQAVDGIVMVRSAGALALSGLQTRVEASVGVAVSQMRVQAFGGPLTLSGDAQIRANNFTGDVLIEASGGITASGNSEVTAVGGPAPRLTAFGGDLLLDGCEVSANGAGGVTVQASGGVEIRDGGAASSENGPLVVVAFGGNVSLHSDGSVGTADLSTYTGPILVAASGDVSFGDNTYVTSFSGRTDVDAFGDVAIAGSESILLGSFMGDLQVSAAGSILAAVDLPEGPNATAEGGMVEFYAVDGAIDLDDMEVRSHSGDLVVTGSGPVSAHYRLAAEGSLGVQSAQGDIDIAGADLSTASVVNGDSGIILVWCHLLNGTIDATGASLQTGNATGSESDGDSGSVSLLVNGTPEGPVESFLLPKNIRAKVDASDSSRNLLVASGFLDTGPEEADLTEPAEVGVGDLFFLISGLTPNASGTKFTHSSGDIVFSVTPSRVGSSRAKFRLQARGEFADAPGLEETITLRFASSTAEGYGIVDLDRGRYTLGRKRGALVAPNLSLFRAKANLKGGGKDVLGMKVGLATDGETPEAVGDVLVGFGEFEETIPGDAFVPSGDRFVYRGEAGGVTSVILDFLKETVTVKVSGVDLGEIPEGGSAVPIRVGIGSDEREVRVRMGRKGTAFIY